MSNSWVTVANPSNYISCYIINMLTSERIKFLATSDSLSDSYSASWNTQEIPGRSAPYLSYSGNDARTVSYSVRLSADIMGERNYLNTIDACKRLVYPDYSNDYIVNPPYCYVRFGSMVKMFAVVNSVGLSWDGHFVDTKPGLGYFSFAEISFDFTELITSGSGLPDYKHMRNDVTIDVNAKELF